jgi:NADPH-dependent 2,4-dienoyl-CoA reductase/sulfur reductase-like enzyme
LEGKTDLQRIKYRPDNFYETNGCAVKRGIRAVKIDKEAKKVTLENGESVGYDKLLIAGGARPFIPRISGLEKYGYHTFMTLDDALKIEKKIENTPNARVLILGAGLIGLKCAEAVHKKAKEITVADMADRILPSILDAESAGIIQRHLESYGIKFMLSAAVDLDKAQFDILCVCTGVIPETEIAKDAGLEVGRGIVIDARAMTSADDIYAAGDCTESYSVVTQKRGAVPILPNAYAQGETAGINMAGGDAEYDKAMPINAIGFFGKHILTAGVYEGTEYKRLSQGSVRKLFMENNALKGFIFIDDFKKAGIYSALIREKNDLSGLDADMLLSGDIGLKAYSKEERDKILRK